ncbi:hypothetical protein SISSUDRAFT_980466, partial [Sistotremastrum suecicum HHB10207 ss-3]
MPTATTTITANAFGAVPLHSKYPTAHTQDTSNSSLKTLRPLYSRATRAFVQREFSLVYSLMESAFALLPPPLVASPDALSSHRKKWDLLRITLESTMYGSHSLSDPSLHHRLKEDLLLPPPVLIDTLLRRSTRLFTPTAFSQRPSEGFLPAQIVVTLVLASLKLECNQVGRGIIEEWLAKRHLVERIQDDEDGYQKVVEIYCLHLLPRLDEWEYADEFLRYDQELPQQVKNV